MPQQLPGATAAGHTHAQPHFEFDRMSALQAVPRSPRVQVCSGLACEDKNRTQCLIWGEEECQTNPGALMRECPQMCGVCTTTCADKHESCAAWAKADECVTNSNMLEICPHSCGVCHDVSKDEL